MQQETENQMPALFLKEQRGSWVKFTLFLSFLLGILFYNEIVCLLFVITFMCSRNSVGGLRPEGGPDGCPLISYIMIFNIIFLVIECIFLNWEKNYL